MNKTVKILLALAMVALMAAPALALESKLSGFLNVRGIGDNFKATNNYVGTLDDSAKIGSQNLVDQRLRMKLDTKINDYLSFTYYLEVDFQWGDEQYSNAGRNDGGGIGADTTNLETKNAYLDVKVPDSTSSFRVGLQGFADHNDYSFFAADMAGVKYKAKLGGADLTAGWFKLIDGDTYGTAPSPLDDVTLWALQAEFKPNANFKFGGDYYYYQNEGSQGYATFLGTADIAAVLAFNGGGGNWTANRQDMNLHYFNGHAEYRLENVVLSGWLEFSTGTADSINNNTATTLTEDLDVQGFAGRLKAATNFGGLKLALAGTYFSGDDNLADGDADFIVNPLATESFAFATDGFMIFTPDIAWNSVGQYGFAMVDAAWAGYGLGSVILTGAYTPEQMKNAYIKAGVGYFSSLEDKLAANDPRTDRAGTELGTEVYLRVGYRFAKKLDLSINGSYASLGDFYDNNGGGTAANTATTDIDDPYEVYLKATLFF
ncbi:hypothetical protein [Geothermobacter hydrogeniphilus]|uniref:Alginate export domain-containing protein n=1 Tax=Geothermobacter hydrogeniphilus TaxID=1969733 RepID=A0A1X0YA64_9BACT|nr:hypothetical protein [Geothermobacter hydrogeniphilus]ORJ62068.1 hypothetical protein B5V00_04775 [Geothermobacter hydrogeniphilus]